MKVERTKTDIYIDKKTGAQAYIEGESYPTMSRRIRRAFVRTLTIFIVLAAIMIYMNVSGRIPFYGNFTDEVYKAKVQEYFDRLGTGEKVDPNLTYDESNPYKTHEDE